MVGEACLPSNAYYPRTPDYTLCSGVHVCWSEHSDSSFVYGFMILDYDFGTMTATTSFRDDTVSRKTTGGFKPVLFAQNLTLNSDAAPNYKHIRKYGLYLICEISQ